MDNENKNIQNQDTAIENTDTATETDVIISENAKHAKPKQKKLRSVYRAKYGAYATAVTAIFLAVVILFNVVLSVLNEKYPITVDLTLQSENTVNPENSEFLKGIDYPVELNVLFTEEMYTNSAYVANYHNITDESNGAYYEQTVQLLKQYHKYNNNIKVNFIDPYGNDINTLIQEYTLANLTMTYGDILIKCYTDGKDKDPKLGVISFMDCYETESDSTYSYSSYESYTLLGNNIEQAVANGIFKTANLSNVDVAVVTASSNETYVTYLKQVAEQNAYTLTNIPVIKDADFSKYDIMIICAPSSDYTENEVEIISKWLENDGKGGKMLLYFASAASPAMPNLHGLLEEWGIAYQTGYKYYSANSDYYYEANTNIYLSSAGSDYTKTTDDIYYSFIANNMVPMRAMYETDNNGAKAVTTLIETTDPTTYKRPDKNTDWKPTGAGETYPAALLSQKQEGTSTSYIAAFSSVDFITNSSITTKTENGNIKIIIDILNSTIRQTDDQYIMDTRTVGDATGTFTADTNATQTKLMFVVFVVLVPLTFIALAIVIYIRRKNY